VPADGKRPGRRCLQTWRRQSPPCCLLPSVDGAATPGRDAGREGPRGDASGKGQMPEEKGVNKRVRGQHEWVVRGKNRRSTSLENSRGPARAIKIPPSLVFL